MLRPIPSQESNGKVEKSRVTSSYSHALRESPILVSLRVDCRTLGASIVYAVNSAILRLLAATLAPIVPLALTMMPLEELLKMLFGMLF